ncbi:Putative GTP cyclohydrolase 1 type 2/Nif3 [Septoria linicola]|uniref:GTP cyclohydrolase 1 type 2/Nif3 n=1 Tax=Septoria linicola TaxID=215465 RepID=A0A9Q9EMU1_9PEZI|nr:Putative GTP cyclohydrolase 1 type 2/Nif3 [Septoria linicola]
MPLLPQPTHTEITTFLQRLLPPSGSVREVPWLWHSPRHPAYNPSLRPTTAVVLSITPTNGFYEAIGDPTRHSAPLSFLHRPWNLDRRAVRKGSLVLASHASFDEHLTVGWNVALARHLELDLDSAACIQGYKDNPDRKIGLVARLNESMPVTSIAQKVLAEFNGVGELHQPHLADQTASGDMLPGSKISVVAIMNAFHEDEVRRVLNTAREKQWIDPASDGSSILYLTGAARDYGLAAIKEVNMPAFCVGHRACEEWGIMYLAEQLRAQWPSLEVIEVLEEEEAQPPPKGVQQPVNLPATGQ